MSLIDFKATIGIELDARLQKRKHFTRMHPACVGVRFFGPCDRF
jgi:hypothetical protein